MRSTGPAFAVSARSSSMRWLSHTFLVWVIVFPIILLLRRSNFDKRGMFLMAAARAMRPSHLAGSLWLVEQVQRVEETSHYWVNKCREWKSQAIIG
jgi:hypothetical protein